MKEHLTEDEQVEALKKWWKENGRAIIVGIVIGLGAVVGYWEWNEYKKDQSEAASLEYDKFNTALSTDKIEQADSAYKLLKEEYSGTSYSALAALLYASYEYKKTNVGKTIEYLEWAYNNPGHDTIKHIARLRLAELYIAENKLDEAFQLVKDVKEPAFDARYATIKGDIYTKRGELKKAQSEYQLALASLSLGGKQREHVQMKLDDLGLGKQETELKVEE